MTDKTLNATEIRKIVRDQVAKSLATKANQKLFADAVAGAVSSADIAGTVAAAVAEFDLGKQVAEHVETALADQQDDTDGTGDEPAGLRIGSRVEFRQGSEWLLMVVTHVHDDDTVSGVAFSGLPARVGWHRGAMEFANVKRGDQNRNWRPRP